MKTSMRSDGLHRSLRTPSDSLRELVASVHPSRLAAGLDASLSAPTLLRLQKSPRLQARLAELLLGNEVDLNGSGWSDDLLLGHDPRRAALLAGSIWHARSVLKLVSKHDLAALIGVVGAEAHAFAVRHVASAVATTSISDPAQLSKQIEHDGHACLGAWLDEAPALDRIRVLVRLPIGTVAEAATSEHRKAASLLLSLVLAHLANEKQTT